MVIKTERMVRVVCSQLFILAVSAQDDNLKQDIDDDLGTKGTPPVVVLMLWLIAAGLVFWFYKEVSKMRKEWMSAVFVVDGHSLSGLKRRRFSRRRNDPHSAVGQTNSRLSQFEAESHRAMAVSQMRAWQKQEKKGDHSMETMSDTLRTAANEGSTIAESNTSQQSSTLGSHGSITYPFRVITDNLSLFQASASEAISSRLKSTENNGTEQRGNKKKISLSDTMMIDNEAMVNAGPKKTDGSRLLSFQSGEHIVDDSADIPDLSGLGESTVTTVDEMYDQRRTNGSSRFGALLRTAKRTMAGNGDYIEV